MMPHTKSFSGISNCYVFKSRLQEYTQKVRLSTTVYQTIKEGPSHEPSFQSTVIVNDMRYDSLLGFANRRAAEQSAAEVALMQLTKAGQVDGSIFVPAHLLLHRIPTCAALIVIPCKKRGPERTNDVEDIAHVPEAKKSKHKNKMSKKKPSSIKVNHAGGGVTSHLGIPSTDQPRTEPGQTDASGLEGQGRGWWAPVASGDIQAEWICRNQVWIEACAPDCMLDPADGVAVLQETADLSAAT